MERTIKPIATIYTEFPEKFGIPRQSRLADTKGMIVFDPGFRNQEALRGLEEFSHIWLIWGFSNTYDESNWSPTVRPPRLGGNVRKGVFATRSPFRPNGLGLSVVRIASIEEREEYGIVILVEGVDILDQTPVFDIKPYIPYAERIPEATDGFTQITKDYQLDISYDESVWNTFPSDRRETLLKLLKQDPRPGFHKDEDRIYGMKYSGYEIKFRVRKNTLHLISIEEDAEE